MSQPPARTRVGASIPRRIVVIEDYADGREVVRMLLALEGHDVEVAPDGPTDLARILETRPDAALIDIGLPGLDGYAVAERVRQARGGESIRLIAFTGHRRSYDRSRGRAAGFDDYLVKPVNAEELRNALQATDEPPHHSRPTGRTSPPRG